MIAVKPDHVPDDRVIDWDVYAPAGFAEKGFHQSWTDMVGAAPYAMMWSPHQGGHWLPTDGAVLHDLFARHDILSNRILFLPRAIAEKHELVPTTLDPPTHTPYRRLIDDALSPRVVRRMEPVIRALSGDLIDRFAARGACDFVAEYAAEFPIGIFMGLCDLPMEDKPRLKYWSDHVVRPDTDMGYDEAMAHLSAYMAPVVAARRVKPGDDLLSQLLAGDIDGAPMDEDMALRLTIQIIIAGLDTVVNLLSFIWHHLAVDGEAQATLAALPNKARAVEELIRRFPLVINARLALRDFEVDGVTVRANDVVGMPTMIHGMDARAHACPMQLDYTRRSGHHSTFGNGVHRCPGNNLARTELWITLEEWFARIPSFRLEPGANVRVQPGLVTIVERLPLVWNIPAP